MGFALIPGLPTTGPMELIIVLVIILLLFGAKRVPELAKGLGTGVREFRKGTRDEEINKKKEEKKDEEQLTAAEDEPETRAEEDSSVEAEKAEQKRS